MSAYLPIPARSRLGTVRLTSIPTFTGLTRRHALERLANRGESVPNSFGGMAPCQRAHDEFRRFPALCSGLVTMLVDMSHQIAKMPLIGVSPLVAGVWVSSS